LKLKNVLALNYWHFSNQQTYQRMSVDLTNAEDFTPLHLSTLTGNLEATKALCERGAPLNNADKDGENPLHLAARCGKIEVFRYLIEIGADINIPDNSNTVLHHAAIMDSVEIIKILPHKGMSVELTNVTDSMPLHFSAYYGNLEATKALVERGAPLTMLIKMVKLQCIWLLTMAKRRHLLPHRNRRLY